ncbi:MAG: hypothetical protein ACR2OX_01135 [Methyloligellaceae bacterium]
MSHDLIIFDADDLTDFPGETGEINAWINAFVSKNPDEVQHGTAKMQDIIAELAQKFGTMSSDEPIWTYWPPICLANGRHCTFNLASSSDITNMTISLMDTAKKHGLVLIDPQGNNPLLTAPDGGGVLDS